MRWLIGAGPPKAILVIFSRSFLIIFCLKALEKFEKNGTSSVRMRGGDHLGYSNISKKTLCSVEFKSATNHYRLKRFLQNDRRRADL